MRDVDKMIISESAQDYCVKIKIKSISKAKETRL
jgi:hypothetical protein